MPIRRLVLYPLKVVSLSSCYFALSVLALAADRETRSSMVASQSGDVRGILVQLYRPALIFSEEFRALIDSKQLRETGWFPSLSVVGLKPRVGKGFSFQRWESLCRDFEGLKEVQHCELNVSLDPVQHKREDGVLNRVETEDSAPPKTSTGSCELIRRPPGGVLLRQRVGLSPFWAQEYTGADLLRRDLERSQLTMPPGFVQLWDSDSRSHGNMVSHLVASPFPSAAVPSNTAPEFVNVESTVDVVAGYESSLSGARQNMPRVINNSMNWFNSNLIRQVVEKTVDQGGVVFVRAAGNDSGSLESSAEQLANNDKLVVVGSLEPGGLPSSFSNHSESLAISAPSGMELLSFDKDGRPKEFSGTSGAAPQVTSALAAFMMITESRLDNRLARKLLDRTALPFISLPSPSRMGSGLLNTYRVGQIAFEISRICKGKGKECVAEEIEKGRVFELSPRREELQAVYDEFSGAFPECRTGLLDKESIALDRSCEQKQKAFENLRRAAFGVPKTNVETAALLWKRVACVYQSQGYPINADYFSALSNRFSMTQNEIFDQRLLSDPSLVRYLVREHGLPLVRRASLKMKSPDLDVRSAAVDVLKAVASSRGPSVDTELEGYFSQGLDDPHPFIRSSVLMFLGQKKMSSPGLQLKMASLIRDPDLTVSFSALDSLKELSVLDDQARVRAQTTIVDQLKLREHWWQMAGIDWIGSNKPLDHSVRVRLMELVKDSSLNRDVKVRIRTILK